MKLTNNGHLKMVYVGIISFDEMNGIVALSRVLDNICNTLLCLCCEHNCSYRINSALGNNVVVS